MIKRTIRSLVITASLLLITTNLPAFAQGNVDFTMNESFFRTLLQADTLQPILQVRMNAHGPLHNLANDCEMHIGGTPQKTRPVSI